MKRSIIVIVIIQKLEKLMLYKDGKTMLRMILSCFKGLRDREHKITYLLVLWKAISASVIKQKNLKIMTWVCQFLENFT